MEREPDTEPPGTPGIFQPRGLPCPEEYGENARFEQEPLPLGARPPTIFDCVRDLDAAAGGNRHLQVQMCARVIELVVDHARNVSWNLVKFSITDHEKRFAVVQEHRGHPLALIVKNESGEEHELGSAGLAVIAADAIVGRGVYGLLHEGVTEKIPWLHPRVGTHGGGGGGGAEDDDALDECDYLTYRAGLLSGWSGERSPRSSARRWAMDLWCLYQPHLNGAAECL